MVPFTTHYFSLVVSWPVLNFALIVNTKTRSFAFGTKIVKITILS